MARLAKKMSPLAVNELPKSPKMAPPWAIPSPMDSLLENTLLTTVIVPSLAIAPLRVMPVLYEMLPMNRLPEIESALDCWEVMAAPEAAVLPSNELPMMVVGVSSRPRAPEEPRSRFAVKLDAVIDNDPTTMVDAPWPLVKPPGWIRTPPAPPPRSILLTKASLARVRLVSVATIPPPLSVTRPSAIVRPSMATFSAVVEVARLAGWMANTPPLPPPSTVSRPAPGPWMFRSLPTTSGPPVSVILVPDSAGAKLTVSPGLAVAIAWRSVPTPASPDEVTVMVASRARPSSVVRVGRKRLAPRAESERRAGPREAGRDSVDRCVMEGVPVDDQRV